MSGVACVGLYVVGVIIGIMLTLWWQAYGARIRRQVWDNYARVVDRQE